MFSENVGSQTEKVKEERKNKRKTRDGKKERRKQQRKEREGGEMIKKNY